MPVFGRRSQAQLATLHHDLQILLSDAIEVYDFSIIQGARSVEEQIRNIERGVSKTINSRHIPRDADGNYDPREPCIAADITPYARGVNPWPQDADSRVVREKKKHRFYFMQGIVFNLAHEHGIRVRQGIDWDMDADLFDQSFDDLPHVELHRPDWPRLRLPDDLLEQANEALTSRGLREYSNP